MNTKIKKQIIMHVPYFLIALIATKIPQAIRFTGGKTLSAVILNLNQGFSQAFQTWMPSFYAKDLVIGAMIAVAMRLIVYGKSKNAKKYRKGVEYGSARFGNVKDIEPYIDKKFENNVILTKTERLTMNNRPKNPKTARNKNVLIVGGSGSGKTRFWLKPNLMQCHSSYVVTDPKGYNI